MNRDMVKRVKEEAVHMLKTGNTIREVARIFHVSKSTVHKDLHERLERVDASLYFKITSILKYHTDIRHIRGGEKTKQKYLQKN